MKDCVYWLDIGLLLTPNNKIAWCKSCQLLPRTVILRVRVASLGRSLALPSPAMAIRVRSSGPAITLPLGVMSTLFAATPAALTDIPLGNLPNRIAVHYCTLFVTCRERATRLLAKHNANDHSTLFAQTTFRIMEMSVGDLR